MTPSGSVERLLAGRIGLDPATVGPALVGRGVAARMASLGLRDRAEYERVLAGSAEELQALVEEVVVPESWFFRDARPFEALRDHARLGWAVGPARPPLAALSLPCAGGEEPYSIAITLLEAGLPAGRFRVDAVDVSARSVARAIAGVYGPNAFRGVDPALRSRHFREQGGAWTVDPAVRSTVRFHLGNILDPALLADRPPFDVVFCRNVLIYFDAPARLAAFASIARLLVDGGLLFLGHADRPDDAPDSPFEATEEKGAFAYRKGPARPAKAGTKAPATSRGKPGARRRPGAASGEPTPPLPPGEGPGARGVAPRAGAGGGPISRPAGPAAALTPGPSPKGRGEEEARTPSRETHGGRSAPPTLDEARKLADGGRYDEAERMVERAIAASGAGAGAFTLLGMIRQAAGDRERAEAAFLKAVYLDGQDDEALLALALLARRRGDVAAESAHRRRLERVRSRKGAP